MFAEKEVGDTGPDTATINAKVIERLYHEQAAKLFRLCFKLVGDMNEAENIIHDVFESVWKRRDSIRITVSLEAYLTQAVKLQALKYFRERAQHEEVNSTLDNIVISEKTTEQQVLYNELTGELRLLVGRMPNQCRRVYQMSHEQGLNNREIASALFISESAVEQHKAKAKSLLQKGLSDFRF